MGLEAVELVMAVEKEFDLQISNAAAARLISVGAMLDYVLETLHARGETPDKEDVWSRLHELIVEQLGVRPEEVTPAAGFVRDLRVG